MRLRRKNPDDLREKSAADLRKHVDAINHYMKQPEIYLPGLIDQLSMAIRAAARLSLSGRETIPDSVRRIDEQLSWLTAKFNMLRRDQQPGSVANESSEMLVILPGLLAEVARLHRIAHIAYRS